MVQLEHQNGAIQRKPEDIPAETRVDARVDDPGQTPA